MTNEQVKADIAANLPDNTSGLITPAILRTELGTMVDYSDTAAAAITLADLGGVPTSRTVNGHALTGDVSVTASDVGLGNVTNAAQVLRTEMGAANGVATLESGGKLPLSQIPDALIGQVKYQGSWDAATNSPTLSSQPDSTTKGYYYVTSTAGTQFGISFEVGDWIISDGSTWQKVDNTDAVVSVAGRIGAVTLTTADLADFSNAVLAASPVTSVAGRTGAITLTAGDVGLGSVENTALSTWTGSANLATVGTITTGTWHGAAIADAYVASAATWNAKVSFPGFGTTAGTAAEGNDARLSDARTPLAHNQAWSTITSTPTTLAGYGITDAQGADSDLSALAGLSTTGLVARTGAGTAATRTITGTTNQVIVTNGDGVAGNPTLSLPQDIATNSTPQFARIGIGGAADGTYLLNLNGALVHGTSTGVGIGTSSPSAKLHVQGSGGGYSGTPGLLVRDATARGTIVLESAADKPADLVMKSNDRLSWNISSRASSDNYNLGFYPSANGTNFGAAALTIATTGGIKFNNYKAGMLQTDATGNVTATTALSVASVSASGAVSAASVSATGGLVVRKTANIPLGEGLTIGTRAKDQGVSGDVGFLTFRSDDAANQLEGAIVLRTDATATNRRLSIECVEQGIAHRNITLAESGGNVGIGTTSPGAKLDVYNATGNVYSGTRSSATNLDAASFYHDGTNSVYAGLLGGNGGGTTGNYGIYNGGVRMVVATSGNVGIGTTDPQAKLDVRRASVDSAVLSLRQDKNDGGSSVAFQFKDSRGYAGSNTGTTFLVRSWKYASDTNEALVNFATIDNGTDVSRFYVNNVNGNVGIGTTSPAAQLHLRSASDNIVEAIRLDNPTDKSDNGSKIVWRNAGISKDAAFFAARRIGSSKGFALTFGTAADWETAAATEKMRIAGNGNVGINNTNPQRKLDVVGDDSGNGIRVTGTTGTIGALTAEGTSINLQADSADATRVLVDASANASGIVELNGGSSGYVQLGTGGTARMQVFANGNVKLNNYGSGTLQTDSSGNVTASSDASLKTVTGSFTRGLADVLKLTPRTYHWNEKSGMNTEDENVGFIAQEVLDAVPEAVGQFRTVDVEDEDGKKTKKREKAELLTLSDRPLIAALVNAVKELKADNDALRARVSALENGKAAK